MGHLTARRRISTPLLKYDLKMAEANPNVCFICKYHIQPIAYEVYLNVPPKKLRRRRVGGLNLLTFPAGI